MEKSDYYYRRRELMQTLEVPTMSEVKSELGEELGSVFLDTCPDPLKPDMGLVPILSGAGDDLWISPSDILIGKVCLKPPFTDKHMKALTHQGILLIGGDIEKKFWNEAELVKQKALEEQEEMLRFMAEMEKRRAVDAARKEEREICREEKEQLAIEFEERLQFELEELEKKLRREYLRLMRQQKRELDEEWEDKLEAAVAETTARLTAQFLEEMAKQEEILLKKFEIELKKENIKRRMQVKSVQDCCQERFMELKHQMECKNIANIMYVLCMERRKCQCEREYFEKKYQQDMALFQDAVTERDIEIAQLKKDLEKCQQEVNLREECLLEILRQFQKFINFALRACPTQAEFLLSVEKMMVFELMDAVCKTDKLHGKRLANKLMRWRSDVELPSRASSSKVSLTAEDYHQCYNEVDTPKSDRSLASADYLAAFHYDKHMYVREEFRNMMSQGIKVSPSNLVLWNKDVEHLQQELCRSQTSLEQQKIEEAREAEEEKLEALKDLPITLSEESELSFQPPKYTKSQQSRRSSVYFKGLKGEGGFLFPSFDSAMSEMIPSASEIFEEIKPKASDSSIIVEGICCKPCTIPRKKQQVVIENKGGVSLIGTKNSLELQDGIFRKTSMQSLDANGGYTVKRSSVGILCAQDSLLKHRMSLKPTSKLFLHRESLAGKDIIALSRRSKSIDLGSDSDKDKPYMPPENDALNVSRLSLSRNSFFVHKQSLIFKNPSKEIRSPQHSVHIKKSLKRTSLTESDNQRFQIVKSNESLLKKVRQSSRLSLTKDSLELIRSQSVMSKVSLICSRKRLCSDESVEIKNGILAKSLLEESISKNVKMSHIEIFPAQSVEEIEKLEKITPSLCSNVDLSFNIAGDSPGIIYHKKRKQPTSKEEIEVKRDNFLTKPNVAHIAGDETAKEHLQEKEEFAIHRVNSLISIFRKHPSLIKTFTPCTK